MEHRSFVYMNDVDSWVKRCEPCSSMEIDLTGSETGNPEPSFWRTKHSIGLTSILRYESFRMILTFSNRMSHSVISNKETLVHQ